MNLQQCWPMVSGHKDQKVLDWNKTRFIVRCHLTRSNQTVWLERSTSGYCKWNKSALVFRLWSPILLIFREIRQIERSDGGALEEPFSDRAEQEPAENRFQGSFSVQSKIVRLARLNRAHSDYVNNYDFQLSTFKRIRVSRKTDFGSSKRNVRFLAGHMTARTLSDALAPFQNAR